MDTTTAIAAFKALAQPTRLDTFRLLVRHEPQGIAAGELALELHVPQNTLSAHLAILARAEVVTSQRRGRQIIYRANLESLQALTLFLVQDCCGGDAELCRTVLADLGSCGAVSTDACEPVRPVEEEL